MFDMPWQDLLFTIGNGIFFLSLLPSIFSQDKPSVWTSFITASTLSTFCFAYYSLDFIFSAFSIALSAGAWWVLFFQKFKKTE
jgi:hypothetical protein